MGTMLGQSTQRSGDGDDVRRASLEEAALCRELRATYERLHVLVGERDYERVVEEVGRTETLLADLRRVTETIGPAREDTSVRSELRDIWTETARMLAEILQAREIVLDTLRSAAEETRSALVRIGQSRAGLGRYQSSTARRPRVQGCRV
jgi:hypothetical protein